MFSNNFSKAAIYVAEFMECVNSHADRQRVYKKKNGSDYWNNDSS